MNGFSFSKERGPRGDSWPQLTAHAATLYTFQFESVLKYYAYLSDIHIAIIGPVYAYTIIILLEFQFIVDALKIINIFIYRNSIIAI